MHLIDFRKARGAWVLTRSPKYCRYKEERTRKVPPLTPAIIPGVCRTQNNCLKLYNASRTCTS